MRLIYYKKDTTDGKVATHYVNLDHIDHFSTYDEGEGTKLYAIIGEYSHLLNSSNKKILNPPVLISRLLELSDRASVDIDKFIDDWNKIELVKQKQKR